MRFFRGFDKQGFDLIGLHRDTGHFYNQKGFDRYGNKEPSLKQKVLLNILVVISFGLYIKLFKEMTAGNVGMRWVILLGYVNASNLLLTYRINRNHILPNGPF